MKKILFILLFLTALIAILFFKGDIIQEYYIYKENKLINSSISWSSERKLKIEDFNYEPEKIQMDNVAVTVGIVSVYKIRGKIYHRSTTIFRPKLSFITDTTDTLTLRIAQARFDLCELYRRKMESKISSLNQQDIKTLNNDAIKKYEELYYDLFEKEWNKFNKIKINELNRSLVEMEKYLDNELK